MWLRDGDDGPTLQLTLKDRNGDAVDLTGAEVALSMRRIHTGEVILEAEPVDITDDTAGEIEYTWDTRPPEGGYEAFARATFADATIMSFPNTGFILVAVPPDITSESS